MTDLKRLSTIIFSDHENEMQTSDQFWFFKVYIQILIETPHMFTKRMLPFLQFTKMHR